MNAETFYKEWTPLHFAAKEDASETAALLLEKGAAVNAETFDEEWTPLHIAAKEDARDTAAILLENGAAVNAETFYKEWTPLHIAAKEDARDTAALLLENGAAVNAKNNYGKTPLAIALEYSADETADLLRQHRLTDEIGQFKAKVGRSPSLTKEDTNDWTDLHYAATFNLTYLAECLLESGAEVGAKLKSDGEPFTKDLKEALHGFAKDYDGRRFGETPLYFAAWENAHAVAELLLNKGADVNARNKEGDTPLDFAVGKTAALLRLHGGRSGH